MLSRCFSISVLVRKEGGLLEKKCIGSEGFMYLAVVTNAVFGFRLGNAFTISCRQHGTAGILRCEDCSTDVYKHIQSRYTHCLSVQ